jgi:putative drug exporter of the RND superfamily
MNDIVAPGRIERLGRLCFRRRWRVLVLTLLALAAAFAIAGAVGGEFAQSTSLPGTESQAATERLEEAGFEVQGRGSGMVVIHAEDGVDEPAVVDTIEGLVAAVGRGVEGVAAQDPFGGFGGRLVSPDGTVAIVQLDFDHDSLEAALAAAGDVRDIGDDLPLPAGVTLEYGGDHFAEEPEFGATGFGLLAAAVVLFVAFGSLLAMGLPIATALLAVAFGMALVQTASRWMDIPAFAPGAVAMIALGAGINYALFIVTRYREELTGGLSPEAAAGRAMATAGTAAFFAGATVVTSLFGLFIVGISDVRSLAIAVAAGVGFVMLASITVLPALLGFVRGNIDRFGLRHRGGARADIERSRWYRWAQLVQRRPLPIALLAVAALLVLSAPVLDMRLGIADASTRSEDDTTHRAHDLVAEGFGAGFNGPILLAVAFDQPDAALGVLDDLSADLGGRSGVDAVLPPVLNEAGDVALVQVIPTTRPQDVATTELVNDLRDAWLPDALDGADADALVGGMVAAGIDFADINARTLPWFIAVVLLAAFVLLALIFRSILVPLKAVLVNLLSVGAAYGVVVAVFQWGWLSQVFGLGDPGPVEPWVPMMLFAITFGLSIDYEVFLLSRIRERFDTTGDNAGAVAYGLARSARLIFAAAVIMVCVFGAFALLADREMQMLGLGLATAIAVDATLVRLVLVPSTMELLGDRNWWAPSWLRRSPAPTEEAAPPESIPSPTAPR